jgi:hypothetical protein
MSFIAIIFPWYMSNNCSHIIHTPTRCSLYIDEQLNLHVHNNYWMLQGIMKGMTCWSMDITKSIFLSLNCDEMKQYFVSKRSSSLICCFLGTYQSQVNHITTQLALVKNFGNLIPNTTPTSWPLIFLWFMCWIGMKQSDMLSTSNHFCCKRPTEWYPVYCVYQCWAGIKKRWEPISVSSWFSIEYLRVS